ncbi:transcriptional adapter 2B-like [Penaeus chinensis]|uniref:transcriptional adapter 2B-like n=1 Tax=Penaeus chinensis TaxID=139456 RepID=UPI001FB8501E|nr:transcriptional adapter 2B-like [Penaeus chinensis]
MVYSSFGTSRDVISVLGGNMADTFAKYHCNYCEEDVNGLRVRCLECDDFDLCLQCFACGAEIGKHRSGHAYQFMDTGNFSIFPGQGHWTAREEVRLLDAIEQYGYGNWEDIARHIETRTPDEARNKYISSYIDGAIGRASWKPALERLQLPIEHTVPDTGPLSPTLGSSLPSQPPSTEENTILGYMPHRDDFEREWDNDAETTIAPLFIHPVDDEDVDMALKLAQVDMYMRRLRERSRRKRVVRDFQVVPQFFKKEREKAQVPPKKKSKDDKEAVAEKLRTISQFQTASEHNNLINSIVRERELRTRIRELLRYRRNGIRHVEECHEFEVARSRRDRKKKIVILCTLKSKRSFNSLHLLNMSCISEEFEALGWASACLHSQKTTPGFSRLRVFTTLPFMQASLPQIPTQMDLTAKSKDNFPFLSVPVQKRRKKSEMFSRKKIHASRYWRWKMAQRELERQQREQQRHLQLGEREQHAASTTGGDSRGE